MWWLKPRGTDEDRPMTHLSMVWVYAAIGVALLWWLTG